MASKILLGHGRTCPGKKKAETLLCAAKEIAIKVKPSKGDILCADRGLYLHYGIYAGNGSVIHFAAEKGDFGRSIAVQKTSLKRFCKKSPCHVCRLHESFARGRQVFSPEETLERAKSRLGETGYNLFSNNCEHFVLWCKTGYGESEQAETLKRVLSAILLVGKGAALLSHPDLRDAIREIVANGVFDFLDTAADALHDPGEKIERPDFSGESR
jgi:hypothetical protein